MKVSAQYAANHLDDLLHAAQNGEGVQIASPDQASFRLTLVTPAPTQTSGKRILGAGQGEIIVPTWEEWEAMDEEIAREMNEGPLIPGETLEETMRWLPDAIAKLKVDQEANPLRKRGIRAEPQP